MEKIVLVGGGGHCKVIIDIIKTMGTYEIIGITDSSYSENQGKIHKYVMDIPILGDDSILEGLYNSGVNNAFITLGALGKPFIREKIFNNLRKIGFNIPILIHSDAVVSPYSTLKSGTCVMAGAVINPDAYISENCIINSRAVIEHDCNLHSNVHVSPGATLCGGVEIGTNSHIGAGSTIIQNVRIGKKVIVGAGSVVLSDVEDNSTVIGIPAKIKECR